MPDTEVIALAVREGRSIVTLDRDFTQIVAVAGAKAPSIVYIRQNVDRRKTVALVRAVLAACEHALEAGCMVFVTEDQMRVRSLPIARPEP